MLPRITISPHCKETGKRNMKRICMITIYNLKGGTTFLWILSSASFTPNLPPSWKCWKSITSVLQDGSIDTCINFHIGERTRSCFLLRMIYRENVANNSGSTFLGNSQMWNPEMRGVRKMTLKARITDFPAHIPELKIK